MQHAGDKSVANAFGESFSQWTQTDPEAASTWLRNQPSGAVRETGVNQMVNVLSAPGPTNDFEAAIQWAASSEDENRTYLLKQVLQSWRKADFDAAAAAGAEYDIPVDRPEAEGSDGEMDIFSN